MTVPAQAVLQQPRVVQHDPRMVQRSQRYTTLRAEHLRQLALIVEAEDGGEEAVMRAKAAAFDVLSAQLSGGEYTDVAR